MEESENKRSETSNRVLIAAIVIFVVTPIFFHFVEDAIDAVTGPMPQILIGGAALFAFIADRIYLYIRSRQKKNEPTS